jgi:hypothetical protein
MTPLRSDEPEHDLDEVADTESQMCQHVLVPGLGPPLCLAEHLDRRLEQARVQRPEPLSMRHPNQRPRIRRQPVLVLRITRKRVP